MSVTALQARIDQLSADIVRQKELLKALEHNRSAAQRQLNALLDPVARLPLEISSEIFILCLPSRPVPGSLKMPMLLLDICNTWTAIALSTPALWSAIHVDAPIVDVSSLLDAWLQRAGSRALSISLPTNLTTDIVSVIGRCALQLRDLRIFHDEHDISLLADVGPFTFLKALTIVGLPPSEYDDHDDRIRETTWGTMHMLRVCLNLVECTLLDAIYADEEDDEIENLIMPNMQHFRFGQGTHYYSSDYVLQHISLPGLKTLFIPLLDIQVDDLLQFLRRSSPELEHIILGVGGSRSAKWTLREMEECLSLLPTLTHFELFQPRGNTEPNHFLDAIARSPHLVPNLSTITFQPLLAPGRRWYQMLLNALLARRQRVHAVRIIWDAKRSQGPPEDVCVPLRQLVADGMKIHIGPEDRNYI